MDPLAREAAAQEAVDPDVRAIIATVSRQMLIVMVNRSGGRLEVPAGELDGTGGWTLSLAARGGVLIFETQRKN